MSESLSSEYEVAELIAAVFLFTVGCYGLSLASGMPTESKILPVTMLCSLLAFSVVLAFRAVMRLRAGKKGGVVFTHKGRFATAVGIALVYVVAIPEVGFYTATTAMVILTAITFGYRRPVGLILGTTLFVGSLALIFHGLLNLEFPTEFFLQ